MADNSKGKHTQIVQVLLPAPEPKKTTRRRRRVARPVAEAVPTAEPAPYNGYTPIYPRFTPGMPSFSPSIDITTGSQYPPYEPPAEPPAGMASIPPIEVEAEAKPKKKKSKLKGIIKAVGRGVATALEAIGEKPTTGGITPVMPEPIIPEFIPPTHIEEIGTQTLPEYIPPRPMPSYQMYQPTPYMLTGEPMSREMETQTAPEVIYAPPPPPKARESSRETPSFPRPMEITPIEEYGGGIPQRQRRIPSKTIMKKIIDLHKDAISAIGRGELSRVRKMDAVEMYEYLKGYGYME